MHCKRRARTAARHAIIAMSERLKQLIASYRAPLLIALMSVIGIFGYAHVSYAGLLPSINDVTQGLLAAAGGLAGFFTHWIVMVVNTIAAKALQIVAFLVDFGLRLNETVISKGIVPVGWKIARDVANLGFTIGLIAISFATILRVEQYGIKKLLPKLVFVALLINFSLLIPGVILDGTNVFSHFFLSKIVGGGDKSGLAALSTQLAASMDVSGFANINAGANNALSVDNLADVIKIAVGGIFIIFFQVLAAIAMGGVAYMIFYRYLVLIFLFIVAPLAWISLFLPALGNLWQQWWKEFFKWAFFLPAMTFFLYLTVLAASNNTFGEATNIAMTPHNSSNDLMDILPVAAQMGVLIGLIFGSLIVAQKFGIAGAAGAISVATGARKFMLGAITKPAVGTAKYFGTRPVKGGAMALANVLNKPALRWIPGMKGAVKGLSEFGQRRGEVEEYMKANLDGLTPDQLKTLMRSKLISGRGAKYLNPVERAALLAKATKTPGMINELFKDVRNDPEALAERVRLFAAAAKQTNPGTDPKDMNDIKALMGVMPELAPELTEGKVSIAEATKKYVQSDKMDEVSDGSYNISSFLYSLSDQHVKNLYENGKVSTSQIRAFEDNVNARVGDDLLEVYKSISLTEQKMAYEKERGASKKRLDEIRDKELRPFVDKRDDLLKNLSSVATLDPALRDRYIKDAKETGIDADLARRFSRAPTEAELVLAMRNKAWTLFKNNRQQAGNPYGTFYEQTIERRGPEEGGTGTTGGGPAGTPAGGAPTPASPQPITPEKAEAARREREQAQTSTAQREAGVGAPSASASAPRPSVEELEAERKRRRGPRTVEELRARPGIEGEDEGGELPPPSLPGTRPPTPPPSRPPTPTPARTPTQAPPTQPTQVPPRAPTPTPERTPTTPSQREATATPPHETTAVPPRTPTRATAEQGVEAEAQRRAQQEREESVKRVREEAERTAEVARKTADANRESAKSEEQRRKDAEKIGKAAARGAEAAKKELEAREAALGVTKETGKETEKILREVEGGVEAAKKAVQEFATLNLRGREDFTKAFTTDKINELLGAEITTPDNKKRIVKSILRNNINPMQTTVVTADDERIDLNQLFKYAEKSNTPIEVKKVKKT